MLLHNASEPLGLDPLAEARPASAACEAWYAVWLRSHDEHVVSDQLAAKGFNPFLPQARSGSRALGARRAIGTPMFPGYLFIRDVLDKRRYIDLLKVHGVVRVLEDGWTSLTPVPDAVIGAIQQISEADVPVYPCAYLRRGERVRVLEGPLAGLEGFFVQDDPAKGRLVVSVDVLGRSIAVEMKGSDVEACPDAAAWAPIDRRDRAHG